MKMKLPIFLLTLILLLVSVYSQQNIAHFQYVYRFPTTYCMGRGVTCSRIPRIFTVAGFWGANANGAPLANCPNTQKPDWNKVFDLRREAELNKFWPSLTTQDSTDLWKNAWLTHGVCATSVLRTPEQYFNRVQRIADTIGDILRKLEPTIVPSNTVSYPNAVILNALKRIAGNNREVSFSCTPITATTAANLHEVTFCYTANGDSLTTCPASVIRGRCTTQNIFVRPLPVLDQMQYVYRWPPIYCLGKGSTCTKDNLQFTLKGFWASDSNGAALSNCPNTQQSNWPIAEFTTQRVTELNKFWPSLITNQRPIDMWTNAWETYGTCMTSVFKTPKSYFNRVERLAKEIGDVLVKHLISSHGIVPCDSVAYSNEDVSKAFKSIAKNEDVIFSCTIINSTHAYLHEATFCYNILATFFVPCPSTQTTPPVRCTTPNIILSRAPARLSSLPY